MAKLSDVAARAGVSVSAVSRVLSGDPSARLSAVTRERVRKAAAEIGYHPNFAGRALKLSRTDVIALIVPDVTNALFTELTRGVEDEAVARGCVMLLARSEAMQPGEGCSTDSPPKAASTASSSNRETGPTPKNWRRPLATVLPWSPSTSGSPAPGRWSCPTRSPLAARPSI
ncbi:hypothetical protein GCM10029992_51140 [Glycomyces albus]